MDKLINPSDIDEGINVLYSEIIQDDPDDDRVLLLNDLLHTVCESHIVNELHGVKSQLELNRIIVNALIPLISKIDIEGRARLFQNHKQSLPRSNYQGARDYLYSWIGKFLNEVIGPSGHVSLISVGCGSGKNENQINDYLNKYTPNIQIDWFGVDRANYLDPSSVISSSRGWHLAKSRNLLKELSFALDSKIVVLADFSAHHMQVTPGEFVQRCAGADYIVAFEQLIENQEVSFPIYQLIRVGYDLIANALKNPTWIRQIINSTEKFEVLYWTKEEAQIYFDCIRLASPHSRTYILCRKNKELK